MSKKMGMVAFRSSGSGISVTSRMGPTIAGMNFILLGPEGRRAPPRDTYQNRGNKPTTARRRRVITQQTKGGAAVQPLVIVLTLYSTAAASCISAAAAAADSPRLYHMSLILKPMVFLMSPYLRRNSITGQVSR